MGTNRHWGGDSGLCMRGQRPEPHPAVLAGAGSGQQWRDRRTWPPPVARGFQTASTQMAESGRKPGLDLAAGRLMTSTGLPQGSGGEEGQQ